MWSHRTKAWPPKAVGAATEALTTQAQAALCRAEQAYDANNFDVAAEQYSYLLGLPDASVESMPDRSALWYALGFSEMNLKRYAEAVDAFTQVLDIERCDCPLALQFRAECLEMLHSYKEALSDVNEALKFKPESGPLLELLGKLMWRLGHANAALSALSQARTASSSVGDAAAISALIDEIELVEEGKAPAMFPGKRMRSTSSSDPKNSSRVPSPDLNRRKPNFEDHKHAATPAPTPLPASSSSSAVAFGPPQVSFHQSPTCSASASSIATVECTALPNSLLASCTYTTIIVGAFSPDDPVFV